MNYEIMKEIIDNRINSGEILLMREYESFDYTQYSKFGYLITIRYIDYDSKRDEDAVFVSYWKLDLRLEIRLSKLKKIKSSNLYIST